MSEPMAPYLIYIHRESVYSPPPPSPSRSYMRRRATSLNESFLSRRYILLGSAIVVILLMCTGVIFAAHSYYHQWGGQGFLRARDQDLQEITPNVFLPMKKIGVYEDGSLLSYLPPFKRDPQMDIPYYACGDQQNSCEAFQQPVRQEGNPPYSYIESADHLPEYLLSGWHDLLRSDLHPIRNILLQRNNITIRMGLPDIRIESS